MSNCTTTNSSSYSLHYWSGVTLHSLLCYWPAEQRAEERPTTKGSSSFFSNDRLPVPSLLLCGLSGSGKTFICEEVTRHVENLASSSVTQGTTEDERSADKGFNPPRVVSVSPSLAEASVYHEKDGFRTRLRRIVQQEARQAVKVAVGQHKRRVDSCKTSSVHGSVSVPPVVLLLRLDHLEVFGVGAGAEEESSLREEEEEVQAGRHGSSLTTEYGALLTDIWTILRSSPPLFTPTELASLGVQHFVVVGEFTGEPEEVHPILLKGFGAVLHLSTPTEAERRFFFASKKESFLPLLPHDMMMLNEPVQRNILAFAAALGDAVSFRTGGVSYRGLCEISQAIPLHIHNWFTSSLPTGPSNNSNGNRLLVLSRFASVSEAECAALSQRIVQSFQRSSSVAASLFRRSAGYVDVQTTRWEDIAGLKSVKQELQQLVLRPLQYRWVYERCGVRPSTGVLLYGPPGTGKTMLAKAMATEMNASFVYVDLPCLIKAEVGESEKRLGSFFTAARERSPAVVFIDELQAAFGRRYQHKDNCGDTAPPSTGSSHESRLVSHLLQCMDAAREDPDSVVLVVGATNLLSHLDPLLLRPGRLDTHIGVPLPDAEARTQLLRRIIAGEWSVWFEIPLISAYPPCGDTVEQPSTSSTRLFTADARSEWERLLMQKEALPEGSSWEERRDITAMDDVTVLYLLRSIAVALQESLVAVFVEHSEGLSGAELRNATRIFGTQFLHQQFQSNDSPISMTLQSQTVHEQDDDVEAKCNAKSMLLEDVLRRYPVSLVVFQSMISHYYLPLSSLHTGSGDSSSPSVEDVRVTIQPSTCECMRSTMALLHEYKSRGDSLYANQ